MLPRVSLQQVPYPNEEGALARVVSCYVRNHPKILRRSDSASCCDHELCESVAAAYLKPKARE
jgi:hypothetical protein